MPLQKNAGKPPRFNFVSIHRIPIAYGSGVCPVSTRHSHGYPPIPAAAFIKTKQGAKDTAAFFAFFDSHPHYERTCFREGWHLHLRTAQSKNIVFDEELSAFRAEKELFKEPAE